jgi:hypothetical protein
MKTKTLISVITAGILGTLSNVNGGNTPVVAISQASEASTAPAASLFDAPAPPTGLTVAPASAANLAAIPPNSPRGYYTNGTTRGYYVNLNAPDWATNQSDADMIYRHTNNSVSVNTLKMATTK